MIGSLVDVRMLDGQMLAIVNNPLTSKELEKVISTIPYKGQRRQKDEAVENAKLPSIAESFYQHIFIFGIPTPEDLIDFYLKKHFSIDNSSCTLRTTSQTFTLEGVKARIYRAYPSLIRDFHFYLLCDESKVFQKVYYSLESDLKKGIDVRVTSNNTHYAVALFVETKRSNMYKKKKYSRHDALKMPEICITIDPFDKSSYVGDYALYSTAHVENLAKKIAEMEDEKLLMVVGGKYSYAQTKKR